MQAERGRGRQACEVSQPRSMQTFLGGLILLMYYQSHRINHDITYGLASKCSPKWSTGANVASAVNQSQRDFALYADPKSAKTNNPEAAGGAYVASCSLFYKKEK